MTERVPEGPHERMVGRLQDYAACLPPDCANEAHMIFAASHYLDRLRAENEALRADARRWQTLAPLFRGVSLRMDCTAHFILPGEAIKPRARTVAEAVDAMAPNAVLAGRGQQ